MNELLIDRNAGVLTITFNRLEKKNAFTKAMYAGMAEAMSLAEADDTLHALVLQGHETVFSAGNDVAEFLQRAIASQESPAFQFLRAISTFRKPIVAAVCGPAVGIGTTLLFHCDLVYAGDNAAFSMPFVNLGLCPEAASSHLAPLLMGYGRAAEALLLGEPFLAETALEIGLVSRIVPPAEAAALAQRQAMKLAAKPLAALIETKRLLKKSQAEIVAQRLVEEGSSFAHLLSQPAARQAFAAFLQKRSPDLSKH